MTVKAAGLPSGSHVLISCTDLNTVYSEAACSLRVVLVCLPTCLLAQMTCLPTQMTAFLPGCLSPLPTHLPAFLPAHPPAFLPAHPPACLLVASIVQEINRMIARSDEEVELFDRMDEEERWPTALTLFSQVSGRCTAGRRQGQPLNWPVIHKW